MNKHLIRAAALALLSLPVLTAQAAPAGNMVVFRRNQTYNSPNFYWYQIQGGAYAQSFPVNTAITVPAGMKFVVTGLRYGFNGQYGVDLSLGANSSGAHISTYLRLVRTPAQGSQAFLEGSEHFTTGISFPAGTQVELKVTKVNAGSADTLVNAYLYGYFEP